MRQSCFLLQEACSHVCYVPPRRRPTTIHCPRPQVEDALVPDVELAGRSFSLAMRHVDIRREIVEKSWATARLQRRFADKVRVLRMELAVTMRVPKEAWADPTRAVQLLTNVRRRTSRENVAHYSVLRQGS